MSIRSTARSSVTIILYVVRCNGKLYFSNITMSWQNWCRLCAKCDSSDAAESFIAITSIANLDLIVQKYFQISVMVWRQQLYDYSMISDGQTICPWSPSKFNDNISGRLGFLRCWAFLLFCFVYIRIVVKESSAAIKIKSIKADSKSRTCLICLLLFFFWLADAERKSIHMHGVLSVPDDVGQICRPLPKCQ